MCCSGKPKSNKDDDKRLPMNCGIRLTPSEYSIAIISDDGDFVYRTALPSAQGYAELLQQLAQVMATPYSASDTSTPIGVCIQGHQTTQDGTIKSLHHPLLDGKSLRRDLQAALNRPVMVASEGQCLASAARQHPEFSDKTTIFALSLDSFVCGGIIVNEHLLTGAHGIAGDWGHLSLPWPVDYELDGRVCLCGRTGCLEHFVNLPGLAHDYEMLTGSSLSATEIIERSAKGDIVAESAMQVIEDRIARGLAMVIGLLDPDIIVVGGILAESPRLFTAVPRKWPGYIRTPQASDILRPICKDGEKISDSYLIGAARLHKYLQP